MTGVFAESEHLWKTGKGREKRKRARKDWITGGEYLLRVNIWGRQEKGEKRGKGREKTGLLAVSIC